MDKSNRGGQYSIFNIPFTRMREGRRIITGGELSFPAPILRALRQLYRDREISKKFAGADARHRFRFRWLIP